MLGLVAVKGMWPQHRRLKKIETLGQETRDLIARRLNGPARSQGSFRPAGKTVTAQELAQASTIYVVGMVLTRTTRTHIPTFGQRLASGAQIRFIILDW